MKWIMMAAGSGTRFGEGQPKPFRDVLGKPMFEYVAIQQGIEDFRLVLRDEYAIRTYSRAADVARVRDVKYIPDTGKLGPAYSALFGTLDMHSEDAVVFVDCDCFVMGPGKDVYDMVEADHQGWMREGYEGGAGVLTVQLENDNPGLSVLDDNTRLKEGGARKHERANVGVYLWNNIHTFRKAMDTAIETVGLKRELKMSDVFNATRMRTGLMLKGEFTNLGTPEELNAYVESVK